MATVSGNILTHQDGFTIQLPHFEGPFDLLLFFIERDELDIHDIPIFQLTKDFLDYLHQMEQMNLNVAAEFILVAGTLMRIKAKMLLPRPTLNEAGEVEDPRTELVNRLLEYKRYKAVLTDLQSMEATSSEHLSRQYQVKEEKLFFQHDGPEEELAGLDLYTIMKAFKRVLERHNDRMSQPKHVIRKYPYTTEQLKVTVLDRLKKVERVDFVSFVLDVPEKIYAVFSFLAILELTAKGHIKLILGEGFNNFWLARPDELPPEDAPTEQSGSEAA